MFGQDLLDQVAYEHTTNSIVKQGTDTGCLQSSHLSIKAAVLLQQSKAHAITNNSN